MCILTEFVGGKMPGPIRTYVWRSVTAWWVLGSMVRERVAVGKQKAMEQMSESFQTMHYITVTLP